LLAQAWIGRWADDQQAGSFTGCIIRIMIINTYNTKKEEALPDDHFFGTG
jgi:hypothetical protein